MRKRTLNVRVVEAVPLLARSGSLRGLVHAGIRAERGVTYTACDRAVALYDDIDAILFTRDPVDCLECLCVMS